MSSLICNGQGCHLLNPSVTRTLYCGRNTLEEPLLWTTALLAAAAQINGSKIATRTHSKCVCVCPFQMCVCVSIHSKCVCVCPSIQNVCVCVHPFKMCVCVCLIVSTHTRTLPHTQTHTRTCTLTLTHLHSHSQDSGQIMNKPS